MAAKKNPDVGQPAVARKTPESQKPEAQTHVAGADLLPSARSSAGQIKTYWYWVGVTPGCPREYIHLAGIEFPKVQELIVPDRMGGTQKQRIPVIGGLVKLSEQKFKQMRERLPRTVIRFYDKGAVEEPGTGKNVGDNHINPRRGQIITIPTDEEVALRRAKGKPTREYVPQDSDTAAAHYMFAHLCEDQENGNRGDVYPPTLEMSGLEWPDKIAEATAELLA